MQTMRIHALAEGPPRRDADYVLYWMTAFRRPTWNAALGRAAQLARERGLPLLVLEAIRLDAPHASVRTHQFALDGMRDNARAFAEAGVRYLAFVERHPGQGRGLLEALSSRASAVVCDDAPLLFLPRMRQAAAPRLGCPVEEVDGNGVLPMRLAGKPLPNAHTFRRLLQRSFLAHCPPPTPLDLPGGEAEVPGAVLSRWPLEPPADLSGIPLDPLPSPGQRGGHLAAGRALAAFLSRLDRYAEDRSEVEGSSGLSAWIHWGHLSTVDIVHAVLEREGWSPERLRGPEDGRREGWWGLSPGAEAFLDQVITWRELAFNGAFALPDHDRYESLPVWARQTLADHAADPRMGISLEALDQARSPDPVWNAAQRQLRAEGIMPNYLRMLWAKKVLEWAPSPQTAFEWLLWLNDRYALDGRDPNSVAGVAWCFGRYDRPWGPVRPIFGTVRYMSSDNTRRKLDLDDWLRRWGPGSG